MERFRSLVYKLYFSYFSLAYFIFSYILITFVFLPRVSLINFDNDTMIICNDAFQGQQIRDVEKTLFSITTQYENVAGQVYEFKD